VAGLGSFLSLDYFSCFERRSTSGTRLTAHQVNLAAHEFNFRRDRVTADKAMYLSLDRVVFDYFLHDL